MIQFSFTRAADGTETIVLMGNAGVRVVPDSHANYDLIKSGLIGNESEALSESELFSLADAATKVLDELRRVSERVTIRGDVVYFDGDEMDNRMTKHIISMIKGGDDNYQGYVKFLENVRSNPSKSSQKGLFRFIERNGLVITEDGCFIGYKGVTSQGKSWAAGKEEVTVTLADGTIETHKGYIPYPVGAVVEMPRSLVDPDRNNACSVGLHVGSHSYATNWSRGGNMLTVKVNPRDVVEVPNDSGGEKLRAHRVFVLETNTTGPYSGTSFKLPEPDQPDYDLDYDGDYEYDPDNELGY